MKEIKKEKSQNKKGAPKNQSAFLKYLTEPMLLGQFKKDAFS
jgi:hypothetical protein